MLQFLHTGDYTKRVLLHTPPDYMELPHSTFKSVRRLHAIYLHNKNNKKYPTAWAVLERGDIMESTRPWCGHETVGLTTSAQVILQDDAAPLEFREGDDGFAGKSARRQGHAEGGSLTRRARGLELQKKKHSPPPSIWFLES
jgi:hypothetical protein